MTTMTKCSESRLAELIDSYGKLVFSICYKITGDYFIAEDIAQETFLAVFQKYETFDGNNEKSWICRIATNKSIDFLRSADGKGVPTEDLFFESVMEKRAGPEDLCLEEEIKRDLERCCKSLKPPYDEIARDYYLLEKTVAEMAEERKMNSKSIQTQVYRARNMLRKIYGREGTA